VRRTSIDIDQGALTGAEVVSAYRSPADIERVFRGFNTDRDVRPIRHRSEARVRVRVFLRMLSYYAPFQFERAPMLVNDADSPGA
jgi:transposase